MAKSTSRPPRRCRRCPDAPLLSECSHRLGNRKKVTGAAHPGPPQDYPIHGTRMLLPAVAPRPFAAANPLASPPPPQYVSYAPPREGNMHPATQPSAQNPACHLMPNTALQGPPPFFTPARFTAEEHEMMNVPRTPFCTPTQSVQEHENGLGTPFSFPAHNVLEEDEGDDGDYEDDEDDGLALVGASETPPHRRPRATAGNPVFGIVEGIRRGNTKLKVARYRQLPMPARDTATSTRRFNRLMQDLIIRCERLAAETGCWLYISGQHVNANSGFYNYSSPRMRAEAKPAVTNISQYFSCTYSALLNARRVEAVNLSLQIQRYRQELQQAKQDVAGKNARIASLQTDLNARSMND